jgi:hypothetical protein
MRVGLASFDLTKYSCFPVYALIDLSVNLIIRKSRLIAMAFCLLVSLLPMQPSAVALPNSQPVGASGGASRVVPIFDSANSQQAVMTGYLYSSRIVFAIDPASGSQDFYVGLPKSLASTTGGRVKVAKVFASQSIPNLIGRYSFAFNRFAVFVLEKDLIAVTPAELLTPEMDIGSKGDFPGVTTAYSYGEYQDRTSPGSQKPCEGGACSKDVRSLKLRILALKGKPPVSAMPNFPDQFTGQIILENSVDPKAGIACYGDGGAPVVASYRNRELYMGGIADQFYVKACGAFPQATYDKDGKMITFGYDTDIAINFISPVYKHTDLINRAKEYATQRPGSVILSSSENNNTGRLTVTYKGGVTFTGFRLYSSIKGGTKQLIKQVTRADSNCKEIPNTLNYSCELPKPTSEDNSFKFKYGKSVLSAAAFNINGEGLHSSPYSIQLCSRYIFIGMRGSGEKYQADPLGIGKTLTNLFNEVKTHPTINGEISVDGVPEYRAVGVPNLGSFKKPELPEFLNETVNQTTMHLSKRFGDIKKMCPDAKFVLAGYSQGAYGVNEFINFLERKNSKDELQALFAGVFLIANPAEAGRGIIPTLDAYGESKVLQRFTEKACNTNEGVKRVAGLINGTSWVPWIKALDVNSKDKSVTNLPLCQMYWTTIIVNASERRLTHPKLVKTESFFYPFDIVADFCRLVSNPNKSVESEMCFAEGEAARAKVLNETKEYGALAVLERLIIPVAMFISAKNIHSKYAQSTDWTKDVVRNVFG